MVNDSFICVVDDDVDFAAALTRFLERAGHRSKAFPDAKTLLATLHPEGAVCVITDVMMDEMSGFDLADQLRRVDPAAAIIFITAWPATKDAVSSIRRFGGIDYIEKPVDCTRLTAAVDEGLGWSRQRRDAATRILRLTPREREVLALLSVGNRSKAVAAILDVSPKTIDAHRAAIIAKTGATSLADIIALNMSGH